MKTFFTTLLASAALVAAHGEPDLQHEHRGDVFGYSHGPQVYGVMHNGNSTGQMRTFENGECEALCRIQRLG